MINPHAALLRLFRAIPRDHHYDEQADARLEDYLALAAYLQAVEARLIHISTYLGIIEDSTCDCDVCSSLVRTLYAWEGKDFEQAEAVDYL